ncbi:CpsD/CapB family tyrosine-protein kinase [Paenibacillus chondroitinus]|uniref:non-specific protein-tyrosine kinase n=1 Tax=Paenibacillus chondroitinus TaxID=59842 RepID=A0ABU6DBP7_9BACL|nr:MULTISPECIES: CpsD/CapB family tyrosine-protein kinase [Paenibacillus]MCY9656663.1 CpsD/CapB family tyrosine-protein kinase [Paenibacillus anseongense]MEB4794312.1 CpsD/CapB family tyrosine-protein kinase [Paenibacillus chondroitinus]
MLQLSNVLVTELDPISPVSESYRSLRTAVRFKKVVPADQGQGMVLMIASPKSQEGKTTTLANLAVTYAQEGKSVVIIDSNLRQPGLHKLFGMNNTKGLLHFFQKGLAVNEVITPTGIMGLDLIVAGGQPVNPSELVGSSQMLNLMNQLKQRYEVILIDSPSTLDYTDASLLSEYSDGVLLVTRNGKTKREWAKQARTQLEQSGARMLGMVFNQ